MWIVNTWTPMEWYKMVSREKTHAAPQLPWDSWDSCELRWSISCENWLIGERGRESGEEAHRLLDRSAGWDAGAAWGRAEARDNGGGVCGVWSWSLPESWRQRHFTSPLISYFGGVDLGNVEAGLDGGASDLRFSHLWPPSKKKTKSKLLKANNTFYIH